MCFLSRHHHFWMVFDVGSNIFVGFIPFSPSAPPTMKYVQGPCAGTRCLCIKEEHAFCSGYTKVTCDRETQV